MADTPYTYLLNIKRLKAKSVLIRKIGFSPLASALQFKDARKAKISLTSNLIVLIIPNSDPYIGTATITLRCPTSGVSIRYTTNGSTPTAASTLYSTPFTITNQATATIKAIAIDGAGAISPVAARALTHKIADNPTFSPDGGVISPPQTVMLTSSASASIRYTIDGSTPTTSTGTLYTVPFELNTTTTVKAIAYYASVGGTSSAVVTKTFTAS